MIVIDPDAAAYVRKRSGSVCIGFTFESAMGG